MVQSAPIGLLMCLLTHLDYETVINFVDFVDVDSSVSSLKSEILLYSLIGEYFYQQLLRECM